MDATEMQEEFLDSSRPKRVFKQRYQLQQILGESNFAKTYLAFDGEQQQPCIIKALSLRLVDTLKAKELFEREAKALSHLDHPRIPRFIDYFIEDSPEGSQICLVQEYIRGRNLAQWIQSGKHFTELEVIRIALETARILEYLQGFSPPIIHRDIKPSNLLLDEDNHVHLVDFGAVRDKILHEPMLQPGGPTIIGTYGYMPMEQFEGRAVPASDIYSLGATLLYLLSHKEPWEMEKDAMRIDFSSHVMISREFSRILQKMIDPDWTRRYQNASVLRKDLEALLHPPRVKSRKLVVALAMFVTLVAAAGIFLWPKAKQKETSAPEAAIHQSASDPVPSGATVRFGTARLRHGHVVYSAVFSPDGKLIASGSEDHTVSIWNAATGAELHRLDHYCSVSSVQFSPDSKTVVSTGGVDTTVRMWNVASGKPLFRLQGPLKSTRFSPIRYPVVFSPGGRFIASLSLDSSIQLWNAASGEPVRTFSAPSGRIEYLAFSPDGKQLLCLTNDGTVSLIDFDSGDLVLSKKLGGGFNSAAFSPDGEYIAIGSYSTCEMWEISTGKKLFNLSSSGSVETMAFSSDGKKLAISGGKTIVVWDLGKRSILAELPGHYGAVTSLHFSPDGRQLVSGGYDNTVRLWDLEHKQEVVKAEGHEGPVHSLAFSSDGKILISGSKDQTTRQWNVTTGTEILKQEWEDSISFVSFVSPQRLLVSEANRFHIVDSATKWEVLEAPLEKTGACFALSSKKKILAVGRYGAIEIRATDTGKILRRMEGAHAQETKALSFSRDGTLLASVKGDASVTLWDVSSGKEVFYWENKSDKFNRQSYVAFSDDGKYLLGGGLFMTMWKVEPGPKLQYATQVRGGGVCTLSPDGTWLATRDLDFQQNIALYRFEAPTQSPNYFQSYFRRVAVLKGHRGRVESLAFSPGSTLLVSGGSDASVLLWNLRQDPGDLNDLPRAQMIEPAESDHSVLELNFDGSIQGNGFVATTVSPESGAGKFTAGKKGPGFQLKQALSFPETSQFLFNGPFTVQFWFKVQELAKYQNVFDSDLVTFDIRDNGRALVFVKFRNRGGHMNVSLQEKVGPIVPDRWYHLAVVSSPPNILIYVDGKLVHQELEKNVSNNLGILRLGDTAFDRPTILESLDELRVYAQARTAEQIAIDVTR